MKTRRTAILLLVMALLLALPMELGFAQKPGLESVIPAPSLGTPHSVLDFSPPQTGRVPTRTFAPMQAGSGGTVWAEDVSGVAGEPIEVSIGLSVEGDPVIDYQFDLYFDTNALSYRDGDYILGDLDQDWPIHDDTIPQPGHIQFGALDWESSIDPGAYGTLVTFFFTVECWYSCTPGETFPLDIESPAGGIEGYTVQDGTFTYLGVTPSPPTPTPTPMPTPTPTPMPTPTPTFTPTPQYSIYLPLALKSD